jgi:hypothetical protein
MPDVWQNTSERIRHPANRGGTLMSNGWTSSLRSWPRRSGGYREIPGAQSRSTSGNRTAASAKANSTGSSSAPETLDVSIISDTKMSWMLVDAANGCLTGYQRTMTFVELGAGEDHLAITRILNAVVSTRITLPTAVFDGLARWLEGYVGSADEPQLRTLLAEIRAPQFALTTVRSEQAGCGDAGHTGPSAFGVGVAS